jgi:hypothetical protein
MMEAVRTSETSVDNYFTRKYIPEDNSEQHRFMVLPQRRNTTYTIDIWDFHGGENVNCYLLDCDAV